MTPRPQFAAKRQQPVQIPAKPQVNSKASFRNSVALDRLPPHSHESEQGVIGSILWSPEDSLNLIAGQIVSPDEFYDLRHRAIYETAAAMQLNMEAVDMITLSQKLKDSGLLEQIGGLAYLNELQDKTPSAANLSSYLDEVQEKSLLRRMAQVCADAANKVYDYAGDAYELLDAVERDVMALRQRKHKRGTIKQHVQEALAMLQEKFERKGAIVGLPTGFPDLDYYTDGLCDAELIVPAAYPGVGKTSLSMNLVEHAVLVHDHSVAVFTQEMTCRQLAARMLCSTAKVNMKQVGRGEMNEGDFARLSNASVKLMKSKLHLVEDAASVTQVVAEARRLKQAHGIRLVVVDYLQLVTGGAGRGESNREQEVGGVAMALKRLAKELSVPVVAPSQMNDSGQLRESRAIGQHGDLILKLKPTGKEGEDYADGEPVDVFIEKNRNGPSHVTVHLMFQKKFTRFESVAKINSDDMPPPEEPAPRYPED